MSTNVCYWYTNFVKIATVKAASFLWPQKKVHSPLPCETVCHSASKERLGDIFVLLPAADNNQSPPSNRNLHAFPAAAQEKGHLV